MSDLTKQQFFSRTGVTETACLPLRLTASVAGLLLTMMPSVVFRSCESNQMSVLLPSLRTWLRRCVLTFLFCATPLTVWAMMPTYDCIVSWHPVTTDIYNLPTSIQGYKVYVAPVAATLQWSLPVVVPPSTTPQTSCKALGLNHAGSYALSVAAYNAAFESPFSQIAKVSLPINHFLDVAGAPNLPLHGTTTPVTVWITGATPTKVQLSRDGSLPFATWPSDTFFTWSSPNGRSLTGHWCITSSCWGGVGGPHILNVVATYATGATATDAVTLNVADSASSPPLSLAVTGAPNLPLNGTTTPVTVWITGATPTKVQLSRDGSLPFATWPSDTFFTMSADSRSLTGNWCITSACWGGVGGPHILNVVATYATGATATAAVTLNVAN